MFWFWQEFRNGQQYLSLGSAAHPWHPAWLSPPNRIHSVSVWAQSIRCLERAPLWVLRSVGSFVRVCVIRSIASSDTYCSWPSCDAGFVIHSLHNCTPGTHKVQAHLYFSAGWQVSRFGKGRHLVVERLLVPCLVQYPWAWAANPLGNVY